MIEAELSPSGDADLQAGLERAAELLVQASHTVVLTGAGISKESGIPTFRGPDGLWTKRGEPPMDGFQVFSADPRAWWQERIARDAQPDEFRHSLAAAAPNAGHLALAELERMGAVQHVITQNVDDLHLRAGTQSLTEIHGNMHWLRCVGCLARWSSEAYIVDPQQLPPRCLEPGCDAVVKSDGVMFGEPIPPYALARSAAETRMADVFMIVGTTAQVYPAAEFPQLAVRRGVPLIEIDPEPTALTDLATVVLRGPAGELLPRLVEAVGARGGPEPYQPVPCEPMPHETGSL
ncbi:MAG: NAD-dependent deacylase [Chloroflexi bacterium]|nr:NAD-dependent deacylase [Chloroflexota bacterium]